MIRIFLPEKFDSYYLFSKKIVGFDIGRTTINATKIHVHGYTTTIDKCVQEKIEPNKNNAQKERITHSLESILEKLGSFDEVRTALPSSVVIFRTLSVPFTSYEKINQIIAFEVEPLLPFGIDKAVIDFIITAIDKEKQSAEVLVAAVQKHHIAQHLELFEAVKIDPQVITVDLFALFGLYTQIPEYKDLKGNVALIDIGFQTTNIALIQNGQLKLIRSLNQGLMTLAKAISAHLNINPSQAMEHLIRFGAEESDWPEYSDQTNKALTQFWQKIQFTLSSFIVQISPDETIQEILLLGNGAEIKGMAQFASKYLDTKCFFFNASLIGENKNISLNKKIHSIPITNIISLSTALPSLITQKFNLRKDEFSVTEKQLVLKQLVTAGVLIILFLSILLTFTFWQTRKLTNELHASEEEAVSSLQERFTTIPEDIEDLESAIAQAQDEITKEEEKWGAFSPEKQSSFLQYLLELTRHIDKERLGFIPQQITISDNTLTLKARVKSFEALKELEQALGKSKFFSHIPGQDDPDFTMKITLKPMGIK